MIVLNKIKSDSIIFDIDGTLWDASNTCAIAWNEVLKEYNYSQKLTEQDARSLSGIKLEEMFPHFFPFVPKFQYKEMLECYKKTEDFYMKNMGGKIYPNVIPTLKKLRKKLKLYIVSNCIDGYIETFIAYNKLHNIFSDYESAGKTGFDKNENLRLIIDRNKINYPVYVGDTVGDYKASKNNNIPFVYASYGFGAVPDSRYKIDLFSDLITLLI